SAIEAARAARPDARIRHTAADAREPEGLEAALGTVAAEMGEIDVLIYNVRGAFTPSAPLDLSYDALEQTLRLEVIGAFAAAKAVLPAMRARGTGMIFFSSATAAFRGSARFAHYAVGKFALRGLSQSLAKAYGPEGVHVAHMRLDCDLDVPVMRALYGDACDRAKLAQPADVAQTYWLTYQQPKGAWSNEVEIRPATETWTY
ncbi:MAG: SDR family NAD(P)-dependent oxidoreductase, partial [Pseudomonadota bacterium]